MISQKKQSNWPSEVALSKDKCFSIQMLVKRLVAHEPKPKDSEMEHKQDHIGVMIGCQAHM